MTIGLVTPSVNDLPFFAECGLLVDVDRCAVQIIHVGRDALALGNMPTRAFFLANHVFIHGSDAGPYATILRFSTNGKALGNIYLQGKRTFNVYNGEVWIRDTTHLVARDRGYMEVTLNAATGKAAVARLPRPAACTPRQFNAATEHLSGNDEAGPDDYAAKQIGAACIKAITQARKQFWKPASFVHQGQNHEIRSTAKAWQYTARDAVTGKIADTAILPACATDRQ